MGHRTIKELREDYHNQVTQIRLQALVMNMFDGDVPKDPFEGDNSLLPKASEVIQGSWKVSEEQKVSLVRSYMRGLEKAPVVTPARKRDSVKHRRGSIGRGLPVLAESSHGASVGEREFGTVSTAFALGKRIDEDAKNFAKACEELCFLRCDTEIGPDGNISLMMQFDNPPTHGQNPGRKFRKTRTEKPRAHNSLAYSSSHGKEDRLSMPAMSSDHGKEDHLSVVAVQSDQGKDEHLVVEVPSGVGRRRRHSEVLYDGDEHLEHLSIVAVPSDVPSD